MPINEIKAKNIITKSNLPDADYVINPYGGCSHQCIYCYARFMKRFSGHDEKWGGYIDVKVNAPDLVPQRSDRYIGKSIFISSVTDPYIALEKKYRLTREILTKLVALKPTLNIQTKSDLVLRDIDVLKQLENCMVGLTLTTLDDTIRREVEPGASSVEARINALRVLKENGIGTYAFIGPILPYVTDWRKIILETKDFVDCYMFENLNTSGSIWGDIKKWIGEKHGGFLGRYEEIYTLKNGYWDGVESEIREFCGRERVEYKVYFHHKEEKKRKVLRI